MKILLKLCALSLLFISSCNDDGALQLEIADQSNENSYNSSNGGYLRFTDFESLEEYIDNCNKETLQKKSQNQKFVSIADLQKQLSKKNSISKSLSDDEIEEMSEDEYNLMKSEELIFDNNLTYVLDTTMRICVGGIFYKITEYGTFSTKEDDAYKIEDAVKNFDTALMSRIEFGTSIILPCGVEYTKSFENKINEDDIVPIKSISKDFAANTFHSAYNVESYKWKSKTVMQKFMQWVRGKDISKENKFSKSKRVKVSLFNVNYKFYASAGIKVKVQKKKKFLGVPYWKETSADKIAIGFNGLEAEMKYNNPRSFSSIVPTMSTCYGSFKKTLNNIPVNFVYSEVSKIEFLKDWTKGAVYFIMPNIPFNDKFYTNDVLNKIYNAEIKEISSLPKQIANKYIFKPIEKQIKPTDPIVAYLVWGNTSVTFNKERPFVTGVEEYNDNSKSVIFDRSFGITITNKGIKDFLPTEFEIKKVDAFGAAYCDGKWLGIRFYYE